MSCLPFSRIHIRPPSVRYSLAELRCLAANATPLLERRRKHIADNGADAERAAARLRRWQQTLSIESDSELLRRRLTFDLLDIDSCCQWLGQVRLPDEQPLPGWAMRFQWLLERCCNRHATGDRVTSPLLDPEEPVPSDVSAVPYLQFPFVDLFLPFVEVATDDLRQRAGTTLRRLTDAALVSFQKSLLGELCRLACMSLGLEFRLFLAHHDPLSHFQMSKCEAPRKLYRRFVSEMLSGGLLELFRVYPVLARLIATAVEHWVKQVEEFCQRLEADAVQLAEIFLQGRDTGPATQLELRLSDPHNRGRSVVSVTFESGLKLIYKPKDLEVDIAFQELLEWVNRQIPENTERLLALRTLKVLNRSTHGWMEFVEHESLPDAAAADRYYRRIGMILCLITVLAGTDFHFENIIASGEQPMLVDLETLLQATVRPWDADTPRSADHRAGAMIDRSVLRSGLLPSWVRGAQGKSFDHSGLGGEQKQNTGRLYPDWKDVNTDRMVLEYKHVQMQPETNIPVLDGEPVSASGQSMNIADGFGAMYRLLMVRRDELLAADGPLKRFRGVKLRQVLRTTRTYATISRRLLDPEFLRDAADRSIEIDRLSRVFLYSRVDSGTSPPWNVYLAEVEAMERLDIPFLV